MRKKIRKTVPTVIKNAATKKRFWAIRCFSREKERLRAGHTGAAGDGRSARVGHPAPNGLCGPPVAGSRVRDFPDLPTGSRQPQVSAVVQMISIIILPEFDILDT